MEKLITINRSQISNSFILLLFLSFILQSCSGDGSPRFKDVEEIEIKESSQGVISEIDEVEPGDTYKVLNEEIIDRKADSKAIVHNLDGTTDTLSFAKMSESGYQSTRSGLRPFLMGTLAASFFTRNMRSSSLNPSNYKSTDAFNKSKGMRQSMLSNASTRRIKVPGKKSKGYGGSKSFRSFGG